MVGGLPMSTGRQKKILLVEDEALIAMAQKMTLEKHGYAVLTAPSGI
jgi:DNA-binding response OmpR family regulator